MLNVYIEKFHAFALSLGPLGIFLGMFLESSIIPIPSEAVLVSATLFGYDPVQVGIWGALGSSLGAIVGYLIGKKGGRPFLNRYGKYILITPDKLGILDGWFEKWGEYAVLIGRLIPFIPYKVFSISSGIAKMDIKKFFIYTFIGSVPRAFMLAYFGAAILATRNIPLIIGSLLLMLSIPLAIDKYQRWKNSPVRIRT